ncbi:MAG: hypothetical protein Q7K43_04745 [Candidatus Woesearchaeota archaeon]|nr:hypothetical protein [Candidatus Woesearchaeota archaeon]
MNSTTPYSNLSIEPSSAQVDEFLKYNQEQAEALAYNIPDERRENAQQVICAGLDLVLAKALASKGYFWQAFVPVRRVLDVSEERFNEKAVADAYAFGCINQLIGGKITLEGIEAQIAIILDDMGFKISAKSHLETLDSFFSKGRVLPSVLDLK